MIDISSISTGLVLDEDGVWRSKKSETISYPETANQSCFAVEDNSFWFNHRNRCITTLVQNHPPKDRGTIFDVGGGNGFVSKALNEAGFETILVEPMAAGVANAKRRGLSQIVQATTDTAGFIPGSLPAVGLFDVVEHIENDRAFLKSIFDLLAPAGMLYITVPSYQFLWSDEDKQAGHFRRYTTHQICRVLKAAGFKISFATYIFQFLPLPVFLLRTLPFRLGRVRKRSSTSVSSDHKASENGPPKYIKWLLDPEVKALSKNRKLHLGGSCLIAACKPTS